MSKARFFSSALDGQTVTLSATRLGITKGPKTRTNWGVGPGENEWEGVAPASLTIAVKEVLPAGDLFAPLPVEWRIRVTGTSYGTPVYDPGITDPVTYAAPYTALTQEQEDTMRLGWEAYDPSYQRCHFVVHTGDTGNYRNTWVGSPAHRNKAYEYGQNCGHVYSEPGTYQRSIYVYDDEGNWGTLALDPLVVVNPDTVFDAASTIVVDPASDWASAPAHDVANRFTTLSAAADRFEARKGNAATPKGMRICIKAGSSFTERCRKLDTRFAKGVCLMDTYGGTDRFTYSERNLDETVASDHLSLFEVGQQGWAWRVKNGIFDFGYDVLTGRPTNPAGWSDTKTLNRGFMIVSFPNLIFNTNTDPAARVVLDNVDVKGVAGSCVSQLMDTNNSPIKGRDVAIFFNDCEFTENADYVLFAPHNAFIMGTALKTTSGSDIGGMGRARVMGTSRGWTGHPILIRETLAWTVYIRACYLESRGSWSGITQTAFRGNQPMMRLNNRSELNTALQPGGWVLGRGKRYYICDSVIAGFFNLDTQGNLLTTGANPQPVGGAHAVVENCFLIHDTQNGEKGMVSIVPARSSIRNCVFLAMNQPWFQLYDTPNRDVTRFESDDNRFGELEYFFRADENTFKHGARLENRHNTFVMLRTDANLRFGAPVVRGETDSGTFDVANYDMAEGHNAVAMPNLAAPQGPAVTAIDLPVGMRLLDAWIKFSWERKAFTLASPVAAGNETPAIPYPVDWYEAPTTGADYATNAGNNAIDTPNRRLSIKNVVSPFVVGETVTGGTSGASAEIIAVLSGRIELGPVTGTFVNNETITSASGSAQANGTQSVQTYVQAPLTYLGASSVQRGTAEGREDTFTVIHDCDAAGVVQGDGTGTHFKILNRTGVVLPAGDYVAILDRSGSAGMTADVVTSLDQATFKLYRPTTPQPLDAGLASTLWDFNRNRRPNAGFAISPTSGTNAAGAILPA